MMYYIWFWRCLFDQNIVSRQQEFESTLLQVIHEKGFKGATMRVLAERLGCDVSNIYNYMSSKQAQLDLFLFDLSAQFHRGIDQIIATKYSAREKVRLLVHLYVSMSASMPYRMSLLVNDWRHLKESRRRRFSRERKSFETKVKTIIEEGITQEQFHHIEAEVATHLVLSSTRWLFNYFTNTKVNVNPLELERQIVLFLEQGLAADE